MSARNVPGKNPGGAAGGGGGGGGGSAAPPAPADSPKKRPSSGGEAASTHLVQAVLAVTLAAVAWYVSVEQPMIRSMSGMHRELMEVRAMQKSKTKEIDDHLERLSATKGAEDFGATVKKYGKEMDKKIKGIRAVVEDSQRQQVKDKKAILEECKNEASALRSLEHKYGQLLKEVQDLREQVEGSQRLERAADTLAEVGSGKLPVITPEMAAAAGGGPAGEQGAGSNTRQAATGGLVEIRGEQDFEKLLNEKDAWVVMFYAPWCAHCQSAEPDFQQAALQASIHFAKVDAVQHSEIAEKEGVKGFPTFKGYAGGRMVKQYSGQRSVTGFLGFAKEIEVLHY